MIKIFNLRQLILSLMLPIINNYTINKSHALLNLISHFYNKFFLLQCIIVIVNEFTYFFLRMYLYCILFWFYIKMFCTFMEMYEGINKNQQINDPSKEKFQSRCEICSQLTNFLFPVLL